MMNKIFYVFIAVVLLFFSCKNEPKLSPIDIHISQRDTSLKPLFDDYIVLDTVYISNAGKYIAFSGAGNILVLPSNSDYQGEEVDLSKVMIKSPSEHSVNGKHFPLELQFVHSDSLGDIVIAAVFVKKGKENAELKKIISNIPRNRKLKIFRDIDFYNLFQQDPAYWTYKGSYTEKPYNAVSWFVMKKPIEASERQIEQIQKIIGKNTVKQVELGQRTVYSN